MQEKNSDNLKFGLDECASNSIWAILTAHICDNFTYVI